jgi:hypothetical protein
MPQDYNVDDILEEIRRKKSRATTSSEAPQHSTYGEETGYSPARPAQRQARPAQGQAPVPRAKNGLADSRKGHPLRDRAVRANNRLHLRGMATSSRLAAEEAVPPQEQQASPIRGALP